MTRELWVILFIAAVGAAEQSPFSHLTEELNSAAAGVVETLMQRFIEGLPESDVRDVSSCNIIYDQILSVIMDLLNRTTDVYIPSLINETLGLELTDVHIYGINDTSVFLESGIGYDIQNLTIEIPQLEIVAANYKLTDSQLGELIAVDGDGALRVVISSIFLTTNLQISYSSVRREFLVKQIRWWEFSVMNSKFELENLGAAGPLISNTLNNLASEMLPAIVRGLNNAIMAAHGDPDQWAEFEGVVMPVVQNAMNEALKEILSPDG